MIPDIRLAKPAELPDVKAMMLALWPEAGDYDFSDEIIYVSERPSGELGSFVSFSIRPWAEGCESAPVPYVEGWWVAPDLRGTGVGRALMAAVEQWCRDHGYAEFGSDVPVENEASLEAHRALGFEPTIRLQFFRRNVPPKE
jgi:aminoglycoside 6'-N-acetyltransferase I